MIKPLEPKHIIPVIKEYRAAYIAATNPKDFLPKRYRSEVEYRPKSSARNVSCWEAHLMDVWMENPQMNQFVMVRRKVPGSTFQASSLSMALQELLNFTKTKFL